MNLKQSQPPATPTAEEGTFRREGQYWTLAYHGSVVHLRDVKGLRYLGRLLGHPGERVDARDLLATATAEQPQPAAPIPHHQMDGADTERARLAVTKRIKGAIHTIESHCPELGYHLTLTIRTGSRCVYLADPRQPVKWTT